MFRNLKSLLLPATKKAASPSALQKRFPQYKIGRGSYAGELKILSWDEGATLAIGNYCSIATGVTILLGGEHPTDWVTTFPFHFHWKEIGPMSGHPKSKGDVTIGSDVWLGLECTVASGVSIGHGAVVGARAVVTKNVPPYAIVAGNPAAVVKYRFDREVIDALLKIEWWNWTEEKIKSNVLTLLSNRIGDFIKANSRG